MASIGLIGDFDSSVPAHRAIPMAIRLASDDIKIAATLEWVPTNEIAGPERISHFDGLGCVPASPYRSMDGALLAIIRRDDLDFWLDAIQVIGNVARRGHARSFT